MSATGALLVAICSGSSVAAAVILGTASSWRSGTRDAIAEFMEKAREVPALKALRESSTLERRRAACLNEMPVLIDTLTLGLSSGLSFDASLELYCERFDSELAAAFREAMLGWRIGATSREKALKSMANELGIDALARFSSVVTESLTFGTPLADALEAQAKVLRDEQRSQVEEEIEKVPVKMLIPLGTLIVPAMLLAIMGPLLASAVSAVG